jgi:hypothetical protein
VSSLLIAFIILVCMLSGVLLGMRLRCVLPEHHTQGDSKDIMITAAGTMATLVALIIGLLLSSAKDSFDSTAARFTDGGAKVITLDYILSSYGAETQTVRANLRAAMASNIASIWPADSSQPVDLTVLDNATMMAEIYNKILELSPQNGSQKYLKTEALRLSAEVMQSRWMFIEQSQNKLPPAFLVVLGFWLTFLSVQFGLLAPRNPTTLSALFVCALSISSAIFFILELNQPLEGIIKVPSAAMHKAFSLIEKQSLE